MYRYEIGGKTYTQKPLVLGQVGQVIKLLEGLEIPQGIDTIGLIKILDVRLPQAMAIVLTPEKVKIKDKDIGALAEEFSEIPISIGMEVIEDFFTCNPLSSILERLSGMVKKIGENVETGFPNSSASSQEETLQKGIKSSGDIP